MICCDLPRGKFPYLVFNLVVFGRLVSSCVTQATLETRVCHSRVYFNSHPTPPLSSYLLLSTSPPQHSLPFRPNLPTLFPMSTQSPPLSRKSTTGPSQGVHLFFSLSHRMDRWRARGRLCPHTLWLEFHSFVLLVVGVRLSLYAPITALLSNQLFCHVISREMYLGPDFSATQSSIHHPSFHSHFA
jgi:hypothetical protein